MNDSSLLDKYIGRAGDDVGRRGQTDASPADDSAITADMGCFGWLRGVRDRAIMLELRKRDGNILAVNYSWLERADFDPSVGITLHFGRGVLRIAGRHLNQEVRPTVKLYEGICRHRVAWIRESERVELSPVDPSSVFIESIT